MAVRATAPARRRSVTRPSLRVVRGKGKARSPIPIILAVVLTVFGVTALHATMSQEGLKAAKLEREVADEMEKLTLQRARVAELSNAGKIADEASKAGLVGDPDAKFLRVEMETPERIGPVAPGQPTTDPLKSLGAGSR